MDTESLKRPKEAVAEPPGGEGLGVMLSGTSVNLKLATADRSLVT